MSNDKGDIWAIYQVVGNNLQYLKTQQWIPMFYGLTALGGIVGLSRLFEDSKKWYNIILPICLFLAYGVTILSTYYVLHYEKQLCKNRKDLKQIVENHFSCKAKSFFGTPYEHFRKNYEEYSYDNSFYIPFLILLGLGFVFVSAYFIKEFINMDSMCLSSVILSIMAFLVSIICFIYFFIKHSCLIKKVEDEQEKIIYELNKLQENLKERQND